jgi:hypothetical protein
VRSSWDAARLAAFLRQEVQSIDPGVTLAQMGTMAQALSFSVSQPRFDTMLLALFAAIALLFGGGRNLWTNLLLGSSADA